MRPCWRPKSLKIEFEQALKPHMRSKRYLEASWGRFLVFFWSLFWLHFRFEVGAPCKDVKNVKIAVSPRRESNFQGSGALKNDEKCLKIDFQSVVRSKSAWKSLLGSILGRFWSQVGPMLASKTAWKAVLKDIKSKSKFKMHFRRF